MEWINPKYPVVDSETVVKENGVLTDLNSVGDYSSLYNMDLLDQITEKELYLLTYDGKLYNGAVKCRETKQKDKITRDSFVINKDPENNVFQFIVKFPDGTHTDARGQYARESLKIVSNRGRKR